MTHATPATKTKKDNRRYCASKDCRRQFRTNDKRQKYCKDECRKAQHNKKRRVDPVEKAMGSKFFYYIAKECMRAGTYEILSGIDSDEAFDELYNVYTFAHRANRFSQVDDYEISHIVPVNGTSQVGLLHAHNLVVAPKTLNRAHGINYFGEGKGIPRSDLKDYLKVKKTDKESQVKAKAIAFLGRDLVARFVKRNKIDVASSIKDRNWINQNANLDNPEHLEIYELAQEAKGKEVSDLRRELKALIDGTEVKKGFNLNVDSMSVSRVLLREWKRHSDFRPELAVFLEDFRDDTKNGYVHFTDDDVKLLFDFLHGVSADDLEIALATMSAKHAVRAVVHEVEWWEDLYGDRTDEDTAKALKESLANATEQARLAKRPKKVVKTVVPFKLNITQPEILTRDLDELYHRRRDERRLAAVVQPVVQYAAEDNCDPFKGVSIKSVEAA